MTFESEAERFWAKVSVGEGCWLWLAYIAPDGYGRLSWNGRHGALAHRVAYELEVGPIPADCVIDHACRVNMCVRPSHLEAVTQAENVRRGMAGRFSGRRGAYRQSDSECRVGHLFDEANTYVWHGQRICRRCRADTKARERKVAQVGL